jgi:hypothetical protein
MWYNTMHLQDRHKTPFKLFGGIQSLSLLILLSNYFVYCRTMYGCASFHSLWICWLHKYFVKVNIQIKLLQAQYISFALWPPFNCSILIFKNWGLNMVPWSLFWPLKLSILWWLPKYSIWIESYLMFWAYYNHLKILFTTPVTVFVFSV